MAIVSNTSVIQEKGLAFFSTASMKMSLCNTTPLTKAEATSTGKCCAIGTTAGFVLKNAGTRFNYTPKGRGIWVKKSTTLSVKKAGEGLKIKTLAMFGSTLALVTKCSTRDYTTGDTINASSFAVIFYDASTAT